jgi:hypothetical protein
VADSSPHLPAPPTKRPRPGHQHGSGLQGGENNQHPAGQPATSRCFCFSPSTSVGLWAHRTITNAHVPTCQTPAQPPLLYLLPFIPSILLVGEGEGGKGRERERALRGGRGSEREGEGARKIGEKRGRAGRECAGERAYTLHCMYALHVCNALVHCTALTCALHCSRILYAALAHHTAFIHRTSALHCIYTLPVYTTRVDYTCRLHVYTALALRHSLTLHCS